MMKHLLIICFALSVVSCADGKKTGIPNSGVIPAPLDRDGNGALINDTEKLPMTGQWCHEIDHQYRRAGSPTNCIADY